MKIYFDSCILISYYSKHKEEKTRKKAVKKTIEIFSHLSDAEFFVSSWGINEMKNILLSRQKKSHSENFVQECEIDLRSKNRLGELKIKIIKVDGNKKSYDSEDFFYEVGKINSKYHPGLGDSIHCVIMENNEIKHILTFDDKDDFKKVEGLFVMNPNSLLEGDNIK